MLKCEGKKNSMAKAMEQQLLHCGLFGQVMVFNLKGWYETTEWHWMEYGRQRIYPFLKTSGC